MRLKKRYGQHLLISPGVISKIVEFAQLEDGDTVVEIGPGTGNLTKEILKKPIKALHVIEVDEEMISFIVERIKDDRLVIHRGEAQSFNLCSLGDELKVLGNLPYNVASLILENLVFHKDCMPLAVLTVQKEVAEKIQKGPSWLSTFVRTFYRVEYMMSIPPRFFLPPPKVDSAVIRLSSLSHQPSFDLKDYKAFLTKLYSNRRKALKNKMDKKTLLRAGIDPMRRAEELSLDEVMRLYTL